MYFAKELVCAKYFLWCFRVQTFLFEWWIYVSSNLQSQFDWLCHKLTQFKALEFLGSLNWSVLYLRSLTASIFHDINPEALCYGILALVALCYGILALLNDESCYILSSYISSVFIKWRVANINLAAGNVLIVQRSHTIIV